MRVFLYDILESLGVVLSSIYLGFPLYTFRGWFWGAAAGVVWTVAMLFKVTHW